LHGLVRSKGLGKLVQFRINNAAYQAVITITQHDPSLWGKMYINK
jgi:hypothetical protein